MQSIKQNQLNLQSSLGLLFSFAFILFGAPSINGQDHVKLYSQEDVDSFNVNCINCTEVGFLDLQFGYEITNLDSLYKIEKVTSLFMMNGSCVENLYGLRNLASVDRMELWNNTNLNTLANLENLEEANQISIGLSNIQNLDGLQNLTSLNSLSLSLNFELESIADLPYFELSSVSINRNPKLKECQTDAICNHLKTYKTYYIYDNGPGCASREQIVETCNFEYHYTETELIYFDEFEQWTPDSLPLLWEGAIDTIYSSQDTLKTIQKVDGLNGSESAVSLNTFAGGWFTIDSPISISLLTSADTINIKFDYCFEGSAFFLDINNKTIWNNAFVLDEQNHVCDSIYTIQLFNIPTNTIDDTLNIRFQNANGTSPSDSEYTPCLILDNFEVSTWKTTSAHSQNEDNSVTLFPNPADNELFIESKNKFEKAQILNFQGDLIQEFIHDKKIEIDRLPTGVYLLRLFDGDSISVHRFVKS